MTLKNLADKMLVGKKFYILLVWFNLSWVVFVVWFYIGMIIEAMKTGQWLADEMIGLLQLYFIPVTVGISIVGIKMNFSLLSYKRNRWQDKDNLIKLISAAIIVLYLFFGTYFCLSSLYDYFIAAPQREEKVKIRLEMINKANNSVDYNDCSNFDRTDDMQSCLNSVLEKSNNIKGCINTAARLESVYGGYTNDGRFLCRYLGKVFSGKDNSDPDLGSRISQVEIYFQEELIRQKEFEKATTEEKNRQSAWSEIESKYEMVYSRQDLAINTSQILGCQGFHSFIATTTLGEFVVYQPCETYEQFLKILPQVPDLFFLQEIRDYAVGVFFTPEDALNFVKNGGYNCSTYHMVHIEKTSRGPIDVYRPCSSWNEYLVEYKKLQDL